MKRTAKQALEGLSVAELESKVREGAEQMFRLKFVTHGNCSFRRDRLRCLVESRSVAEAG